MNNNNDATLSVAPDVNPISRSQRVDQVLLGGDGTSVSINVSFQVQLCDYYTYTNPTHVIPTA